MLHTTYDLAKKHKACQRALKAWKSHAKDTGKKLGDTKIPLIDVLNVLGMEDCLWAFRATNDEQAAKLLAIKFAIACADRVLIICESKYPKDNRPRKAIEAAQTYLLNPSKENARAAADAAYAAHAAAYAAYAAADAA